MGIDVLLQDEVLVSTSCTNTVGSTINNRRMCIQLYLHEGFVYSDQLHFDLSCRQYNNTAPSNMIIK